MTLLGSEHSVLIRSKFRSVLQLRLQQRRTREQLADQGIMPRKIKTTKAVKEKLNKNKRDDKRQEEKQIQNSREMIVPIQKIDYSLKDQLACGPALERTVCRLATGLNTHVCQSLTSKPVPAVSKNSLFTRRNLEQSQKSLNHGKFPKQEDSYAFEEDSSSESSSPEQHHSDESQGPSSDTAGRVQSSSSPALTSSQELLPSCGDRVNCTPLAAKDEGLSGGNVTQNTTPITVPAMVKSKTSDKNRHKKPKDVKPKVKKLKYHQYIPPDQKAEKSPPPMDSAYARLLHQQQLFLQLQILSQQKHAQAHQQPQAQGLQSQNPAQVQQRQSSFSYQPHQQSQTPNSNGPSSQANSNVPSPVKNMYPNQSNISPVKPGPLPPNLDDLKVSELRQHLRIRGMPVSGTKTALIERLRPFKDSPIGSSPSASSDITTVTFPVTPTGSLSSYQSPSSSSAVSQGGYYPYPSTSSTPPISPASSELSLSGSLPESFSDVPMSSPTQFGLQPSPQQFGVEDSLGGNGLATGCMKGMDAEKDKMLVEKQKVIEELTWKLHQEQRQVEELKMQLHKRKRCYGATQDPHSQVTIKQEPMSLSSSCPLSSPKQLKNSSSSCMEDMGHCAAHIAHMAGPDGPGCMDTVPSSGSPCTMSAFLSPQCSPQDSPIRKPSSSPHPPSPSNTYLLVQQKNGDQATNCSYPSEQRGLQMSILPSPGHVGQKGQVSSPAFSSSESDASDLRQPPCYEDAIKQQMTRSQQMDELLDVLIESGEMPANAKEERERSSITKGALHINVPQGPGVRIPRFHRLYEHLTPAQLPLSHSANPANDNQFENMLGSGPDVQHEKILTNRDLVDTPLSPLSTKLLTIPEVQGMVSMTFSETPWETMEWLDLTPPSSATAFSIAPPTGSSIFNAEFLDVTDINLNSAMDLHLEHW
uniref:Myocardin n=1 Tax=Tetraodon nigroviridis TaxID=99883 RepID=H3C545_TETNG